MATYSCPGLRALRRGRTCDCERNGCLLHCLSLEFSARGRRARNCRGGRTLGSELVSVSARSSFHTLGFFSVLFTARRVHARWVALEDRGNTVYWTICTCGHGRPWTHRRCCSVQQDGKESQARSLPRCLTNVAADGRGQVVGLGMFKLESPAASVKRRPASSVKLLDAF